MWCRVCCLVGRVLNYVSALVAAAVTEWKLSFVVMVVVPSWWRKLLLLLLFGTKIGRLVYGDMCRPWRNDYGI